MRSYYKAGDYNAICDRCGLKHKASGLHLEWTGSRVCKLCWESRHPQTLIRVPREDSSVPWSRPEATEVFISVGYPLTDESGTWLLTEDGIIINTEG